MADSTGKAGENYVAEFLQRQGFRILERNFRTRFGEIDLIACDEDYLVFVEVKTRGEKSLGDPLEAVTPAKQRRIFRTAMCYLQSHPSELQPRFDAAGVTARNGKPAGPVRYVENAFQKE